MSQLVTLMNCLFLFSTKYASKVHLGFYKQKKKKKKKKVLFLFFCVLAWFSTSYLKGHLVSGDTRKGIYKRKKKMKDENKEKLVWFLCLIAYQAFVSWFVPRDFRYSQRNKRCCFLSTVNTEKSQSVLRPTLDATPTARDL